MTSYLEKYWKQKRFLVWLFLVLLFVGSCYLELFPLDEKTHRIYLYVHQLNNALFTTLFTLISFNLFYQIYTEKENREIAQQDIIEAIVLDNDSLSLFTLEAKKKFIRNIVCSIIGDRYGDLLYNNMINKYLQDIAYRENFEYDVELNEAEKDFNFKGVTVLSRDQYYSLDQNLVYTKHFKKEIKDLEFKIVFAFDDKSLDYWMGEEFVFFREVLQIEDWESNISNYTKDDFKEFVEKCLSLKLTFFNNENVPLASIATYNINYIDKENVNGVEIVLKDKKVLKDACYKTKYSTYYRCKISFNMPFNKKIKRFHFVLPEPTLNPKFRIRFGSSFKNIDYFTHFSNTSKSVKPEISGSLISGGKNYTISTSEIIYPRSGIVFFWQ